MALEEALSGKSRFSEIKIIVTIFEKFSNPKEILKQKAFSLINIVGMVIGMTSFTFLPYYLTKQ